MLQERPYRVIIPRSKKFLKEELERSLKENYIPLVIIDPRDESLVEYMNTLRSEGLYFNTLLLRLGEISLLNIEKIKLALFTLFLKQFEGDIEIVVEGNDFRAKIILNPESSVIRKFKAIIGHIGYELTYNILRILTEIAIEGIEGLRIGALIIVGNPEEVLKNTIQIIPDPFISIPRERRNIKKEENWKGIKEFFKLDGAILVDLDGYIVSGGLYVKVDKPITTKQIRVLGGRRLAAMVITKCTNSVAFGLSATGQIFVCKDGEIIFEQNII
ncbi:MAG: diadenylate cyclase [Euryarchaeota archaeon]|nr:diadenylate cyclase [Euryarchaeota archaeon]